MIIFDILLNFHKSITGSKLADNKSQGFLTFRLISKAAICVVVALALTALNFYVVTVEAEQFTRCAGQT